MAGTIGGGGLGDIAIRYGYRPRFRWDHDHDCDYLNPLSAVDAVDRWHYHQESRSSLILWRVYDEQI